MYECSIGYPMFSRVIRRSIVRSFAVLAATNSDPYVEVSTVFCFLEKQSIGVLLMNSMVPVTARPVRRLRYRLA